MTRLLKQPGLAQVLAFCAEAPIERVFLEDVARRGLGRFTALADGGRLIALCHVGANLVPSGAETALFAEAASRSRPRMIVGEDSAVTALWEAIEGRMPVPLDDRPGQPVYVTHAPPPAGGSSLRAARVSDLPLLVRACAAAYLEEVGVDAHAQIGRAHV